MRASSMVWSMPEVASLASAPLGDIVLITRSSASMRLLPSVSGVGIAAGRAAASRLAARSAAVSINAATASSRNPGGWARDHCSCSSWARESWRSCSSTASRRVSCRLVASKCPARPLMCVSISSSHSPLKRSDMSPNRVSSRPSSRSRRRSRGGCGLAGLLSVSDCCSWAAMLAKRPSSQARSCVAVGACGRAGACRGRRRLVEVSRPAPSRKRASAPRPTARPKARPKAGRRLSASRAAPCRACPSAPAAAAHSRRCAPSGRRSPARAG